MSEWFTNLLHTRVIFPETAYGIHLPALVPYIALFGVLGFTLGVLPLLIMIDRVVIAFMQDRPGPNRVGPRGAFQAAADVMKLFFKESFLPKSVDVQLYYLAPFLTMLIALSASAVLPVQWMTFETGKTLTFPFDVAGGSGQFFARPVTVGDVNIGLLYILAMSSLGVYGLVLAGWSSNNKYSLLGGLRASAQLISYELSMGLAILCVVVLCGSVKLSDIVAAQNTLPFGIHNLPEIFRGSVFSWNWLQTLLIPVVIYTVASVAETNRAPFDLPEAESELVAGFHTEYSAMKFATFFAAEYVNMLTVSGLNAALFWGGSLPPLNIALFHLVPGFVWFALKVMMGIFLFTWMRATLPRLRYDALMNLGWKRMLPAALVWLFLLAGYNLIRTSDLGPLLPPNTGISSENPTPDAPQPGNGTPVTRR